MLCLYILSDSDYKRRYIMVVDYYRNILYLYEKRRILLRVIIRLMYYFYFIQLIHLLHEQLIYAELTTEHSNFYNTLHSNLKYNRKSAILSDMLVVCTKIHVSYKNAHCASYFCMYLYNSSVGRTACRCRFVLEIFRF